MYYAYNFMGYAYMDSFYFNSNTNLLWNFEDWSKHAYKYNLLAFLHNHLVITFISPVF